MKKLLAAVMILMIILLMSPSAFASDTGAVTDMGTGRKTIDVTASYEPSDVGTVYNVDIVWDDMSFTYTENRTLVWQPDTHSYSSYSGGGWNKTRANITVTNHSNAAVNVEIIYTPMGETGVTGEITNGAATLQAENIKVPEAADSLTAILTISGKPNGSVTSDGVKIGTVTIKIS